MSEHASRDDIGGSKRLKIAHWDPLAKLHPANRHGRDKIRQQLEGLRNLCLLTSLDSGVYRLSCVSFRSPPFQGDIFIPSRLNLLSSYTPPHPPLTPPLAR